MNASEIAIAEARRQIQADNLGWIVGTGYGLDFKAICQKSELRYGPAWRTVMAELLPKAERYEASGKPEPAQAGFVTEARTAGQSWGYIAIRMNLPEGRVRKLWALGTGFESCGLRIGRGGRFVATEAGPALYTGKDRKDLGSEIKAGQKAKAKPTVKRVIKVAVQNKAARTTQKAQVAA